MLVKIFGCFHIVQQISVMENQNRIRRGWRKENALPAFSGHVTSGQRNVQKNVNINLFVDTGSHTVVSHHWGDPTVPVPNHSRATVCGGPRAAFVGRRSVKSQRHGRVQTNLPCPDWPFQDVTSSVFNSRQQSNLESKLQRCRAENVTRPADPNPLSATAFGPSHPCLHRVTWKGNAPRDFSDGRQYRSRRPSRGFRLHDLSHTCNDPCKRRLGDKDRYVLNRPLGLPSLSEGSGGAHKGSFSSTRSSSIPSAGSLLHNCRPPNCSCQEVDAFSPGPPLTLDLLDASDQSEASSLAFQALLRSSQASADLHGSIQQSKKEATQMGALGSFPWESKTAPLPYRSCLDPGVTTSAVWSIPEDSCARQASVKWQASLARDWGLRATVGTLGDANSIPVGFGCKNTRLYRHPVEALGQCWPEAAHSSNDSTSLAFEAKEDYSNPSICYLGCCSGCQKVPQGKTTCHLPKSHYHHQRIPNPEEHFSRLFCSPRLGGKDFPLGLPSLDGSEVSLETLCAGTPANKSVAMYDTQRDVHLTVGLPRGLRIVPVRHFGNSSEELGICEPWSEPVGIGETSVIAYAMDDYTPFLPPYKPSPFRVIARNREHPPLADGTDGVGVAIAERLPMGSHHSSCEDLSTKPPHLEEQHQKLERGPGSMDRQRIRPASQQTDPLLEKGFGAWRDLVLEKKAAAQALYERQLLRKGLGALKWALQLRDIEVGIAQQAHARAVLATSFRRWQAATARKRKDRGAPQAAATPSQGVPAPPGEEGVLKGPAWCQLSAEQLKGAAQYSRAEGNLWLQLHRTQGVAELCAKAQAVRDVRRLAAAFRLWRLQKERQEEEEAQVQAALAILGGKRLRNAFWVWRSRSFASRQVLTLTAQVQSRWISRCFKAWKSFAEREAQSRRCLEHQRARSVGLCFRQWALMAQVQERTRKSLLELFALKRRKLHGLNTPETEMCWNVAKWSQWNRADTLEGLYHLLRLQAAFQIWVVRWQEHQLANVFRRTLEQRQLRESLRWWHWKAFRLDSLACCNPKDLTEDPLLASLDLEESSLSSGFHSNAPALPVSSPFIKENSPGSGSHTSISSLGTVEDSGHHPQTNSPSLRPSPDPEEFVGVPTEVHVRASSPPTNGCIGENGFLKDGFQSLGFLSPSSQIQPIVTSSMWDRVQSRGNETEWQLLVRCFEIWSAQTRQNLKARQHHRQTLLTRFFTPWAVAVARAAAQRMALVQFEHSQQQRLLALSFEKWKAESASVVQQQREAEQQRRPSGQGAAWRRWRKATCRARGMDSVERACNFWTRAAAFGLCAHQRSSLVGARKCLKMPLSWTVAGGCRAKRRHPGPAPDSRLTCSSFRLWLMMYRSQSRTLERLPGTGSSATPAQSHESSAAADHRRGLGRKYLRRWRDNVHVRHFQDAWKMRQLVSAWLLWKDACRTALGLQALAQHRLVQWGWQTWRRRCLQSWVAERFLEAADRRLLERVFGRWQRLAALRTEGKVNS
ncbi:hypothetical protein lerEdw1_003138 [Lerista edwardsae]|nr:hypothetical protein lerEdw1_003138 [Lerista edwardsae]